MRRLSTVLWLLLIAHNLFAQRKSKNAPQSFLAIEIGAPIFNRTHAHFPILLNTEWQRKNKQWGFGASIALQYDRESMRDCSKRTIDTGRALTNIIGSYRPYCETFQYFNLKPSVFGSYYFLHKKQFNAFVKLGSIASISILEHREGEYYEIETKQNGGITVKDAGPIKVKGNVPLDKTLIGLLSGLGVNYFPNKKIALRFTLQSELYRNSNYRYDGGALVFALGSINFKI